MANLFSDNFNRADNSSLGADWTERLGNWDILSNKMRKESGTNTANVTHTAGYATADYSVTVDITATGGTAQHRGPCSRRVNFSTSDSDCYTSLLTTTGNELDLYKRVSGTYTKLADALEGYSTVSTETIKLEINGTTIKQFANGVEKSSVTDSSLSAAGDAGILVGNIGDQDFDNFSVDDLATGGQTVAVGQVTETDVAQAITWEPKNRLVGQVSETDLAQPVTSRKTLALGQATEGDLAQAVSSRKSKTVGQVTETDLAQTVAKRKAKAIGQVIETDLAQSVAAPGNQIIAVGQALETDEAQAVAAVIVAIQPPQQAFGGWVPAYIPPIKKRKKKKKKPEEEEETELLAAAAAPLPADIVSLMEARQRRKNTLIALLLAA